VIVKNPGKPADHNPMYGRWPFRQGTALGMAVLMLLAMGVIAMMQSAASRELPPGFAIDGEYLFADECGACHGTYGYGTDQAPSLIAPEYAESEFTRADFVDAIEDGHGSTLAADELEPQEIADIIAFLREIQLEAGV
jgi:mono/diheme cytochrome c family protein